MSPFIDFGGGKKNNTKKITKKMTKKTTQKKMHKKIIKKTNNNKNHKNNKITRSRKNIDIYKTKKMKGGATQCPPTILEPGFKVTSLGDIKGLDIPDSQAYLKKINVKSVSHPMIN